MVLNCISCQYFYLIMARGAQGKGPSMDLVSYVSVIKIDADGLCASQAQYVWDIM